MGDWFDWKKEPPKARPGDDLAVGLDAPLPPTVQEGAAATAETQLQIDRPGTVEVPAHPGLRGSRSAADEAGQGEVAEAVAEHYLFNSDGPTGPGMTIMDEGLNSLPFGGQAKWNEADQQRPEQIERAITEGAQAEADLGDARKGFFERQQKSQQEELAIIRQRQFERQQEIEQRQSAIHDATIRYSNDLADRGQYWRRPEHIMAAFGAALLSAGSPGDPSVGLRLIGQAVNTDFAQRKALADMSLGEMRSNLANYRQIAGDAQLGDKLAYAESTRIAAMELERIAAQFQGPIAKQKAAAINGELMRSYTIQMGQLNAAMRYNKPTPTNPAIKASYLKTGQATDGQGYTPFAQGQAGSPGGSTGQAGGSGGSMGGYGPGQPAGRFLEGRPLNDDQKAAIDKRAPGASSVLEAINRLQRKKALDLAGGNEAKARVKLRELQADVNKEKAEIAKAYSGSTAPTKVLGYRRMKHELDTINNLAVRMGVKHDDLIGTGAESITGAAFQAKYNDFWNAQLRADPKKADEITKARQDADDAVQAFKQAVAMQSAEYVHEHFGSSFTAGEQKAFEQAMRGGWRGITKFVDVNSRQANASLSAFRSIGSSVSRTLYRIGSGLGVDPLDVAEIEAADPQAEEMDDAVSRKKSIHARAANTLRKVEGKSRSDDVFDESNRE